MLAIHPFSPKHGQNSCWRSCEKKLISQKCQAMPKNSSNACVHMFPISLQAFARHRFRLLAVLLQVRVRKSAQSHPSARVSTEAHRGSSWQLEGAGSASLLPVLCTAVSHGSFENSPGGSVYTRETGKQGTERFSAQSVAERLRDDH